MNELSGARRAGVVTGLAIAFALPVSNGLVAVLWNAGILRLDPDGPVVAALTAPGLAGVLFGPVGLVAAALCAGLRDVLGWIALLIVGIPVLTIAWFVAIAAVGGLSGEPF